MHVNKLYLLMNLIDVFSCCRVVVWSNLKTIVEHIKNMLDFPNGQCSQNAVTAAGNLLIAIHKMSQQTQIPNEQQLIQNGKHQKYISQRFYSLLFRMRSSINGLHTHSMRYYQYIFKSFVSTDST